jgi:hypothetical protein
MVKMLEQAPPHVQEIVRARLSGQTLQAIGNTWGSWLNMASLVRITGSSKESRRQSAAQEIADGLADWEEGRRQPRGQVLATFVECLARAIVAEGAWPTILSKREEVTAMKVIS